MRPARTWRSSSRWRASSCAPAGAPNQIANEFLRARLEVFDLRNPAEPRHRLHREAVPLDPGQRIIGQEQVDALESDRSGYQQQQTRKQHHRGWEPSPGRVQVGCERDRDRAREGSELGARDGADDPRELGRGDPGDRDRRDVGATSLEQHAKAQRGEHQREAAGPLGQLGQQHRRQLDHSEAR